MARALGIAIYLSLLIASLASCRADARSSETVTLVALIKDPSRYDHAVVCTAGVYLQGFEASALGASTYSADGLLYLSKPAIWVEGAEITSLTDCIASQGFHFCQATVCGQYAPCPDGCGHLGGYGFQITAP